ncbi:MAG: O-antigen ligase family protein [Candidatus Accumulibacter sp. UW25]|jgi:O-antigen ligase
MKDLAILFAGIAVVGMFTRIEPISGWWRALRNEHYLMAFVVPLLVLFGWPLEGVSAFRDGDQLGWQRVARMVFFGLIATHFVLKDLARQRTAVPPYSFFSVFGAYTLLCALSAFWSRESLQSLWKAIELVVVLMVTIELYQSRKNPVDRAASIAGSLMFLTFALCLMSIIGAVLAPERAWRDWGLEGLGVRSMGGAIPMINPNMLGQLGGMVAMVGILRFLLRPRRPTLGDLIVPAVGVVTLFLAYSRTSLIACLIIFVLTAVSMRRSSWLVVLAVFGVIIGTFFLEELIVYLVRGQTAEQFATLTGRLVMWDAALSAFWERPLFGHGFFVGHKYVEVASTGKLLATADSTYVETLVNLGFAGLTLISLFAIMTSLQAWRSLSHSRYSPVHLQEIAMVFFVVIAFTMIRSVTASSFQVLHYNLVFLLIALIGLAFLDRSFPRSCARRPNIVASEGFDSQVNSRLC